MPTTRSGLKRGQPSLREEKTTTAPASSNNKRKRATDVVPNVRPPKPVRSDSTQSEANEMVVVSCKHLTNSSGDGGVCLAKTIPTINTPDQWACKICHSSESLLCLRCGVCFCEEHCQVHFDQQQQQLNKKQQQAHCLFLSLNCCDERVICLSCGGRISPDNNTGPIKKLRTLLEQIQSHDVHAHEDDSSQQSKAQQRWRKLRNYVRVPFLMHKAVQNRSQEDLVRTAILRHKLNTLSTCFALWRERTEEKKAAASSLTDCLPVMGALVRSESLQVRTKSSTSFAGRCGLRNLGNTCYMNSAVQALSNARKLRDYFYYWDLGHKQEQKQTTLTECLHVLIKATWGGKMGHYTPDALLQAVWKHNKAFAGFKQQDVQEFVMFLLNKLVEESKLFQAGPSYINSLLAGISFSQVECSVCGHRSRLETEYCGIVDLSIPSPEWLNEHDEKTMPPPPPPLPLRSSRSKKGKTITTVATKAPSASKVLRGAKTVSETKAVVATKATKTARTIKPGARGADRKARVSLSACLDYTFKHVETLEGENAYRCLKCKKLVPAVKSVGISRLPTQYLVLHLSRSQFNMKTLRSSKNQCHVDFPLMGLDMAPYSETKPGGVYDLIAVVVHHGRSMNVGHYTSFGLRTKAGEDAASDVWMLYNDAEVQVATETEVLNSEACLLWFECRTNAKSMED